MRSNEWATSLIAACIVVPQLVVALFSPWVGKKAEQRGRKPLLFIGLAALPALAAITVAFAMPETKAPRGA